MENKTAEPLGQIAISKNVHPNVDGSPWGWIVLEKSNRVRLATWSGYNELRMCEQIVASHNASLQCAEMKEENGRLKASNERFVKAISELAYLIERIKNG